MTASDKRQAGFDFDVNLPEAEVSASEEVEDRQRKRRGLYLRVFGTPDGQELLAELVNNFTGPLGRNDTNAILICEGGRRVVNYIQTQVNAALKDEEVNDAA